MRKVNPEQVCKDFRQEVKKLLNFYRKLRASKDVRGKANQSTLSEIVFHRAYVLLERTLSQWYIGCINRNSSNFLTNEALLIKELVKKNKGDWQASHTTFSPPAHVSLDEITKILDEKERNIIFQTFLDLEYEAKRNLASKYVSRLRKVPKSRQKTIDGAKRIRNYIAHGSTGSLKEMNQSLKRLPDAQLKIRNKQIKNIGAYLRAGLKPRIEIYLEEFDAFAAQIGDGRVRK